MEAKYKELESKCYNIHGYNDIYASDSLKDEAISKNSDLYINAAYTDYGGTIIDKYFIQYMKENYPENVISENTSYCGENAFIFGEIVEEIMEKDILYFDDFEDYLYDKIREEQTKEAERYIKEKEIESERVKEIFFDYFYRTSVVTFGVEYNDTELDELINY